MQSMMTAYMDQSKKMFQKMQDQLQSQTRNMFTGLQVSGVPERAEKP
jgi:polyhydroxyalkanoate synthesis regulator protein